MDDLNGEGFFMPKPTGSRSMKRFLILWSGQLLSSVGSGLTAFALGVYAFEKTGTASSVALITLLAFLPSILLRPVGGMLADRHDRRLLMAAGDAGAALSIGFMLLMLRSGADGLWPIHAGVTAASVFSAVLAPAYKASATDLLGEEQYAKGSGLMQLAESARFLLSPVIAGLLLSAFSIETVLLANIGTYIAAVVSVLAVRRRMSRADKAERAGGPHAERGPAGGFRAMPADLAEGWRVIAANRGVAVLIWIISLVTFFIGFLQALIGPMMLPFTDARTLGVVQSAGAVGMLASSILIGAAGLRGRYVEALAAGLAVTGLSMAFMGATVRVPFITASAFLFLAALPFVNAAADVLVRKNIPNDKQGRAWGLIGVLSQLGFAAAYGVAGPLADRVFNPMLLEGGLLASTAGRWIGTGPGRGIGLMFVLAGLCVAALALRIPGLRTVRALARREAETEPA